MERAYHNITRIETFPFPKLAVREAVFNALVHNNYARGIPIQISVYEDKLYIGNDTSGLEIWTPEKLMGKHRSIQTNPGIANVFFRCGFIEAWGRGIEKICRECDKSGNKYPTFDVTDSGIMVRFDALEGVEAVAEEAKDVPENVLGNDVKSSVKSSVKIIEAIRQAPFISADTMANSFGISLRAVEKQLASLKSQGRLRRIGPDKGGYWEVVES